VSRAAKYFGSERSLVQALRRAPEELSELIAQRSDPPIPGDLFEWRDAGMRLRPPERRDPFSVNWRGVGFVEDTRPSVAAAYRDFWTQSGNLPSWDAAGVRVTENGDEWLLVEAKAHLGELRQSCLAKPKALGGSREAIEERLDEVKASLGARTDKSWLDSYYQFANRIATLWFLHEQGVEARLVHVCFTGGESFADAARTADEWDSALAEMDAWIGRPFDHPIEESIHTLVLTLIERETESFPG
jgi:hypothetical protein